MASTRNKKSPVDSERERLRAEIQRLRHDVRDLRACLAARDDDEDRLPELPGPNAAGLYPAVATARVLLARKLIRARLEAGLTRRGLARRAGVRLDTLRRLESGRHSPSVRAVDKIDRALREAGATEPGGL